MTIALDLIVLAIILLNLIICYKRGFVKVIIEAVGIVAAIILAFTLSSPIADLTYDKIFGPAIVDALTESTSNITEVTAEQVMNVLPEAVVGGADLFGFDLTSAVESATVSASGDVSEMIVNLSENAIKPIVVGIIGLAATVIIFVVLSIIVKILAKLLNGLFSFSFVGKINHTLGGVIGAAKGIVIAAVFCITVSFLISVSGKGFLIFTAENISGTYIFKYLAEIFQIIKF